MTTKELKKRIKTVLKEVEVEAPLSFIERYVCPAYDYTQDELEQAIAEMLVEGVIIETDNGYTLQELTE